MPTTVYVRRRIDAPPEEVWAVLSDISQAPRWNSAWQAVAMVGQQREGVGTVFRAVNAAGLSSEFEVVQWVSAEYIAFASRNQEDTEGIWISVEEQAIHLRPTREGQTEVTLAASARSHGLRGWLVSKLVWPGYQRRGLNEALDSLEALFLAEEEPAESSYYEEPE
ncbi:MAG TPA: SRPBCC family protein [Dehalococcoidia bacterium]|nr:SRPBCC family protein [Dehalococcoidia bacterium]